MPRSREVALDPDYYVTPKKLHPQDLKDAKELTRQPVWVREGYRYTYYPYAGHSDFEHPAGTLGPIEKLDIKDVVLDRTPGSPAQKQVMAVFKKDGKRYAFPIGVEERWQLHHLQRRDPVHPGPARALQALAADIWKAIENQKSSLV